MLRYPSYWSICTENLQPLGHWLPKPGPMQRHVVDQKHTALAPLLTQLAMAFNSPPRLPQEDNIYIERFMERFCEQKRQAGYTECEEKQSNKELRCRVGEGDAMTEAEDASFLRLAQTMPGLLPPSDPKANDSSAPGARAAAGELRALSSVQNLHPEHLCLFLRYLNHARLGTASAGLVTDETLTDPKGMTSNTDMQYNPASSDPPVGRQKPCSVLTSCVA